MEYYKLNSYMYIYIYTHIFTEGTGYQLFPRLRGYDNHAVALTDTSNA